MVTKKSLWRTHGSSSYREWYITVSGVCVLFVHRSFLYCRLRILSSSREVDRSTCSDLRRDIQLLLQLGVATTVPHQE